MNTMKKNIYKLGYKMALKPWPILKFYKMLQDIIKKMLLSLP